RRQPRRARRHLDGQPGAAAVRGDAGYDGPQVDGRAVQGLQDRRGHAWRGDAVLHRFEERLQADPLMSNVELFKKALAETRDFHKTRGPKKSRAAVEAQLSSLSELGGGPRRDRERLNDINIGRIAVQEVEGSDEALAELLHQVNAAVRKMPR